MNRGIWKNRKWEPVDTKDGELLYNVTLYEYDKAIRSMTTFCYDFRGNLTDKTDILGNYCHYDSMNRLVAENCGDSKISYKYDLSGNRISRVTDGRTETYLYNSRNQLTELTGDNKHTSYTYDPAGNLVEEYSTDNKRIYTYDAYNRNIEITGNEFKQTNHYDAEGYRYSLEENDKVTNFVYRGGIMLAELDEAGNQKRTYTLGNEYAGQQVNSLNNSLTSENKAAAYYITDEQGSIRYILDQSGEVLNFYQYSAFGETVTAEESIPNRLRYNAQTEDELTGLYYLRARYYAPNTGRFTQEDVIYNDGLNLYAYCDSNPVMYCDPSGFAKTSDLVEKVCDPKVGGECGSESGKNSPDLYHYTDENGAKAISETGTIRADDRGRVFVTTDEISPQDANNALFMGVKGDDCATYRVEITLTDPNDYRLSFDGATQPNELIYYGSIRNGKNATIVIKENDF